MASCFCCKPHIRLSEDTMRVAIFAIALFLAASCRAEVGGPFVSGDATRIGPRDVPLHQVLNASQLGAVSSWLEARREKWNAQITEPSSEPILASLRLVRGDGETVDLSLVHSLKGDDYLRVWLGPGLRWAYQSVLINTRYAQQPVDESAEKALLSICFNSAIP